MRNSLQVDSEKDTVRNWSISPLCQTIVAKTHKSRNNVVCLKSVDEQMLHSKSKFEISNEQYQLEKQEKERTLQEEEERKFLRQ